MPRAKAVATPEAPTPKRRPRVSVLDRRLQNPFGEPSAPIRFTEKGLDARWFNSGIRPDQFWRAQELGWEKVTPDMIKDITQIGSFTLTADGAVARGERAQEVLMYMPTADRIKIQAAKTAENNRRMGSPNKQKQEIAEALGTRDPQGADFLDRHVSLSVDTKDYVETRQITPEPVE